MTTKQIVKWGATSLGVIIGLCLLWATFYTVDEGHVGIVKRFGEAKEQVPPGLHLKMPIADSVEIIEVRTRKSTERLPAATSEQMPVDAVVSVNWTVNKASAFDLFVDYGGLDQFEDRILDTRMKSATKSAISKFTAEELIINRAKVIHDIAVALNTTMSNFPVTLDSVQIDNIGLPKKYLASIETKQTEKNLADAEKHKLDRFETTAQQTVKTAEAEAKATRERGDADAYALKVKGEAEAAAIEAKAQALRDNPLIVQLTLAQKWDGAQPRMITGDSGLILQMPQPE
ncbi:prohibitin family protein [Hahella ganghwensis]|uniref:prohibitin family protein n=1 Tax=Hahella ganghwensis TaxID=286420 RepID=UPI0003788027|nr:prohibitin family protein [Hahella ganghwensis]